MPSVRASLPPRERDYDWSKIGTVGRRTGTTLAPRKLDEHGLEEVSGMFSSPKKPSPVKRINDIAESVEQELEATTPKFGNYSQSKTPLTNVSATRSTQRASAVRLRSASPRKSGITGTARRSNAMNLLGQIQQDAHTEIEAATNAQTVSTPTPAAGPRASSARPATTVARRRFSPDKTPLGGRLLRGSKTAQVVRVSEIQPVASEASVISEDENTPSRIQVEPINVERAVDQNNHVELMGDLEDEPQSIVPTVSEKNVVPDYASAASDDDEDEDETFQPPEQTQQRHSEPAAANSRRKRRSSAVEVIPHTSPSPAVKRRKKNDDSAVKSPVVVARSSPRSTRKDQQDKSAKLSIPQTRPPLQTKSNNTKLSSKMKKQVTDAVEKIRARPGGAARTLHLLRRETPSDDTVVRTRTGRLSVKPLAYWRNEKVVFTNTGDEASTGLADGARFPLNTVGYVHRIDEEIVQLGKKKSGAKKGKTIKKNGNSKGNPEIEESDVDDDDDNHDPDAAEWEVNSGTIAGEVAVWDTEHQVHTNLTETIELAHSSGAIQTNEVKGSTFRFAKLLSSPFFGTGIVDLPPGGVKKVKNSRKMHMAFFVCSGRVTVDVGPQGGPETRFSIGKGGYWQVPRGNNYAILNEHGKNARLFFSQACEVPFLGPDE